MSLYSFRKIKDSILTNGAGLENRGNYFVATKERAFLDVLYLNKDYNFDNLSPLSLSKIHILLPIYNNKRMTQRVNDVPFSDSRVERQLFCFMV